MSETSELFDKLARMMLEDKIKGHTISFVGVYIDDNGSVVDPDKPRIQIITS